jgi:hypothetical protein
MSSNMDEKKRKEEEEAEIKKNIEALKNKIGDARTGGKGSQRRKVKVINKNLVIFIINLREETKLLKASLRKLVRNNLEWIRLIFLRMITLCCISLNHKYMHQYKIVLLLSQVNPKPKILRICYPIFCSSWDPNNIKFLKISCQLEPWERRTRYLILLNLRMKCLA